MLEILQKAAAQNGLEVKLTATPNSVFQLTNLIAGKFQLVISNEILSEYIEILGRKTNSIIANNVAELLLTLKNVRKSEVYYRWNLIKADADDNKFADCAIAANADFIVSNDRHFGELKNIDFPKIKVINSENLLLLL